MVKKLFEPVAIDLKGRLVAVKFVRNNMSRRIILRLDQNPANTEDGVVVTLPKSTSVEQGLELIFDKADWILKKLYWIFSSWIKIKIL